MKLALLVKKPCANLMRIVLSKLRPCPQRKFGSCVSAKSSHNLFFARYLNVSRNLVSDWERGVKNPGGPALRLLSVIKKNGLAAIA